MGDWYDEHGWGWVQTWGPGQEPSGMEDLSCMDRPSGHWTQEPSGTEEPSGMEEPSGRSGGPLEPSGQEILSKT